jgi:acetylornithine deacetylase/succinyl-diaminopimelate desuccinylase-like protein
VDAIEKAGKLAGRLDTDLRAVLVQKKPHPLAGSPKIHNSIIEGGSGAWNVVPDYCKLGVERRTLPGETTKTMIQEIETQIEKIRAAEVDALQKTFTHKISKTFERLPLETKPSEPIVRTLQASVKEVLGDAKIAGMPFWTDAAHLSHKGGIPSVVFGPGRIEDAHTKDEKIELAQVYSAVEIFEKTITSFLGF